MLLLSVVLAFSAVACGGGEELDDSTSYFFIITVDSGYGSAGVKQIAKNFEEKYKDYEFAPGKKGVVVDVEAKGSNLYTTSIAQEAYHCYINPKSVTTDMAQAGTFINIDEYMKETIPGEDKSIDDKVHDFYKDTLIGTSQAYGEGYYYAPGISFGLGMSYDKNIFDEKAFYFVSPGEDDVRVESSNITGQEVVFFASVESDRYQEAIVCEDDWTGWNSNHYLSCGPDGVYETHDDGMPSSLEELIMLCELMKGDSVSPFVVSGKYLNNHQYSEDGLNNSLLGPEHMYTMKTFEGEDFEIVTGYEANSELWGMSTVKKPKTAKVKVTPSQGYYTTIASARYYSTAFWQLAVSQNWYTSSVTRETSHIEAQADFIFNGFDSNRERAAIMLEASYWVNESQERLNFSDFTKMHYAINGEEREAQIKWMSLPRQIFGTVAEGEGTPETFMWGGATKQLFNAVYADDPEALEMIRQWLLYYYSDENIKFLTASTGCPLIGMDYDLDYESELYDHEPFYRDLFRRVEKGLVVSTYDAPKGGIYKKFPEVFGSHAWGTCWTGLDSEGKTDLYTAFKTKGYSVQHCFEKAFMMSKLDWRGVFDVASGTDAMSPTADKDADGNEIAYNP